MLIYHARILLEIQKILNTWAFLVGGWTNPFWKDMQKSNWIISPEKNGVQHKTHLSCHHWNAESETKRLVFLVLPFSVLDPY